jgi:H+/Cl- antiporter ClcA
LARISSYIETNKLPQVLVGSEITNTVYVEPKALVVPYTESHKWPLNTLLIFVVIIIGGGIGWYLYRYMGDKKPENWNN